MEHDHVLKKRCHVMMMLWPKKNKINFILNPIISKGTKIEKKIDVILYAQDAIQTFCFQNQPFQSTPTKKLYFPLILWLETNFEYSFENCKWMTKNNAYTSCSTAH